MKKTVLLVVITLIGYSVSYSQQSQPKPVKPIKSEERPAPSKPDDRGLHKGEYRGLHKGDERGLHKGDEKGKHNGQHKGEHHGEHKGVDRGQHKGEHRGDSREDRPKK